MPNRTTRAIGIIGKAPRPGEAKTRLVPPLNPAQAALLAGAFLHDTALVACSIPDASVFIIHPPSSDTSALIDLAPSDVTLIEQQGSGVGDAMLSGFQLLLSRGASAVVLIGSDLPTLPAAVIEQAFTSIEGCDDFVALGPAEDGGYYLIAMRSVEASLFQNIAWSTSEVFEMTAARVRSAGLRLVRLPTWHDIDQPSDLERIQELLSNNANLAAPATRDALQAIALAIDSHA